MNLRDLQYFTAVADLEHFGQAAGRCFVSQPTLSGQIKKLEAELGVMLFERTNRRVMLTEAGREFLPSARRILREVEHMQTLAKSQRDPFAGKFRLGAFPTLAPYVFPNFVPILKKALPKLRLILIEEKTAVLTEMLLDGAIDAALLALPIDESQLEVRELFDDEFMLAVPPDHELSGSVAVEQGVLNNYSLLLLQEGHCLRDQALDVCQLNGAAEEQEFRATGLETLRQMVKAGTGITFMPRVAIKDAEAGIEYIPFAGTSPKRTIGLVWRKTSVRRQITDRVAELVRTAVQQA